MKTIVHKANSRGHADHGWLNSFHTFSFAGYYSPERVNFGALRVLNDDTVAAGRGFGKHPHMNMEIISIPLSGALKHEDSTGREKIIKTGDVQIMSAGKGIRHSEYNASEKEEVQFLQIWVMPKEENIAPRYEQKSFDSKGRVNKFQVVVSPSDEDAVWINQNAYFYLSNIESGKNVNYTLQNKNNGVYVFVLNGRLKINNELLNKRDGIGITEAENITIDAQDASEVLLIEVPML